MERRYTNCLDYGSGPGIFLPELKRHADKVIGYDLGDVIKEGWKFDLIVCSSVLEFCHLNLTLKTLQSLLKTNGTLLVASPMSTPLSKTYFTAINDGHIRHSHTQIIEAIESRFKVEKIDKWMGLYFALRAKKK